MATTGTITVSVPDNAVLLRGAGAMLVGTVATHCVELEHVQGIVVPFKTQAAVPTGKLVPVIVSGKVALHVVPVLTESLGGQ
jgi:hypothetical protein